MDPVSMGEKIKMPMIERPESGIYISLEGISGSGKTYTLNQLRRYADFTTIKELTDDGDKFVKGIFELVSTEKDRFLSESPIITTGFLVLAAQMYSIETKITEALEQGKTVVVDRSVDSPALYQAILYRWKENNIDAELSTYYRFLDIFRQAVYFPDKTFVLDSDLEVSIGRAEKRDKKPYTTFEKEVLRRASLAYPRIKDGDRITHIADENDRVDAIMEYISNAK